MDMSGEEEIPSKFIDQAISMEFMHDPVKIGRNSRYSYDRASLERLWDTSDQYNQCPYRTDGRFDIRDITPNWNLRKKAEKWVSKHRNNSGIAAEGVISDYRKPIMETEMQQRLDELNELIRLNDPTDDVVMEQVKKKLRMLRLQCQYHYPNRLRLVTANGQNILLEILHWNSLRTPDLRAEVLRILVDLHNYGLDIPQFLRQNLLSLIEIVSRNAGDRQILPRGLRFDAFHLLRLAICDWEFESQERLEKLMRGMTIYVVENFSGDESMKHTLPILLHLSGQRSTRSTLCGDGRFMQQLNRRIKELSETILRNGAPARYLEMSLSILYNLVAHDKEGRSLFLNSNTCTDTVHRLVQLKADFPDKLSDAHLHISLRILGTIYSYCAQPQLLSAYITSMHRPLINILTPDASFPPNIRRLARKILRRYLLLQSFLPDPLTAQPSIINQITTALHLFAVHRSRHRHHQNDTQTIQENRE